jgi:hypothetical protein
VTLNEQILVAQLRGLLGPGEKTERFIGMLLDPAQHDRVREIFAAVDAHLEALDIKPTNRTPPRPVD